MSQVLQTVLSVVIDKVQFNDLFSYFITVQLQSEGEKRRTDKSQPDKKPTFLANYFQIPLKSEKLDSKELLIFEAFTSAESENSASLYGQAQFPVGKKKITESELKEEVTFIKKDKKKDVKVGTCMKNVQLPPPQQEEEQASEAADDNNSLMSNNGIQNKPIDKSQLQGNQSFKSLKPEENKTNLGKSQASQLSQTGRQKQQGTNMGANEEEKQNQSQLKQSQKSGQANMGNDENNMQMGDEDMLQQQYTNNGQDEGQEQLNQQLTLSEIIGNKLENVRTMKQKWEILSKELQQKQEIIHRMIKEVDDKTQTMKGTGQEVVTLRKQQRFLKEQNTILKKRIYAEQQIQLHTTIPLEVHRLNVEELKTKIINVATAYRDERLRNEEFEKALKDSQQQIAKIGLQERKLEELRVNHQEQSSQFQTLQDDIAKKQLYDETIEQQAKVIAKLEKLMENTLKDAEKSKQAQQEMRTLQTEVVTIQSNLKKRVFGEDRSELESIKYECLKLEHLAKQLKEDLDSKRGNSQKMAMWEGDQMDMMTRMHRAKARIDALQEEMQNNAKQYAQETALIKLELAQKQAQLDTLTINSI